MLYSICLGYFDLQYYFFVEKIYKLICIFKKYLVILMRYLNISIIIFRAVFRD